MSGCCLEYLRTLECRWECSQVYHLLPLECFLLEACHLLECFPHYLQPKSILASPLPHAVTHQGGELCSLKPQCSEGKVVLWEGRWVHGRESRVLVLLQGGLGSSLHLESSLELVSSLRWGCSMVDPGMGGVGCSVGGLVCTRECIGV